MSRVHTFGGECRGAGGVYLVDREAANDRFKAVAIGERHADPRNARFQ